MRWRKVQTSFSVGGGFVFHDGWSHGFLALLPSSSLCHSGEINLVGLHPACLVRGLTVGEEGDWGVGESFRLWLKRKQISKPRAYER